MKRFLAPLFGLLLATAAHAQSGLLPANQVWAGPPSGGQGFARARALVSADLPALAPGGLSLASGQIMVGQVSGFAGAVALSGDCTIVASGAVTCTKTNGVALSALATTAPGTGVATALGVAVGSAGSVVTNGGALGTPSSGVGTNLTALNAGNLSSGTVAAARGGAGTITGALKGNGAGLVTQAACADLSNGGTACSQGYTAGTWTPTIITTGTTGTPAYSIQVGSYEQIGRHVTARFTISLSSWSGSPTGTLEISLVGAPTPTTTANDYGTCYTGNYIIAGAAGSTAVMGYIAPSTTVVVLSTGAQTGSNGMSTAVAGTTPQFIGTCEYRTN